VLLLGMISASAGSLPSRAPNAGVAAAAAVAPTFQPSSEAVYVPITPCRIVDTRSGTGTNGTPITNAQTRTYYVAGTFGFAPQGGKSGGCGILPGAVSIAAVVTGVQPSHGGYIRAWPNGQAEPTATILNYGTISTGTGATVSINPNSTYSLKLRNYGGPTDVVVDVTGYYAKQLGGFISPSGGTYAGSSRIVSSTRITDPGVYEVKFDRDVRYCSAVASAYYYNYYASTDPYGAASADTVRVRLFSSAGAAVNGYFAITINC
jgi:hypothetical protein